MKLNEGLFAVKLYELDRHYGMLQSRIQLCQHENQEKIRQGIEALTDECAAVNLMLEKNVQHSQSLIVSNLASAHLNYQKQVETDIRQLVESHSNSMDRADALALYAEFAIDFSTQAMNHALLAAMYAVDAQLDKDHQSQEG